MELAACVRTSGAEWATVRSNTNVKIASRKATLVQLEACCSATSSAAATRTERFSAAGSRNACDWVDDAAFGLAEQQVTTVTPYMTAITPYVTVVTPYVTAVTPQVTAVTPVTFGLAEEQIAMDFGSARRAATLCGRRGDR